jgi:hypothetical protein
MYRRRHGSKPTLALWMLVAVADVALFAATAGLHTVLLVVAGLVTAAGAVLAVRLSHRHDVVTRLVRLQRRNSAAHPWLLRRGNARHWLVRPVPVRRPGRVTAAALSRRRA